MNSREITMPVRRLLLVDDTPEDRTLVRRMLRKREGYDLRLTEADSVEAGVRALEETEIDCVLLDHNLPDGHGVDVLAEFRKRQPALPIAAVYLTNAGIEAAAVAALQAGAQDFVSKDGLTTEAIWRAVDNAIERVGMVHALADSEKRYRALSRELEQRVERRTADLQKAVDELSGFTYSVSHDLRAPIRAIVSSSRILIEDHAHEISPEAMAQLERQEAAGVKLGKLVDDLLEYARLGGERLRRLPVDVTALAEDVVSRMRDSGENAAGVEFEIEQGLNAVADPAMLEIALTILFDNAAKYRCRDDVPHVALGREGDAFAVRDNGIGFDARFIDKLFRPFERLHRDQDYPGTGIGLANARRIVERHGGLIWAESGGLGKGSTFRFTLGH